MLCFTILIYSCSSFVFDKQVRRNEKHGSRFNLKEERCLDYSADGDERFQLNEKHGWSIISYDDLEKIRADIDTLRFALLDDGKDESEKVILQNKIRMLEQKDPDYMYAALMDQSKIERSKEKLEELNQLAIRYRKCLPHFHLDGVWVGKYGDESGIEKYDFVEVKYEGDTLIATKKSGEQRNIPVGEVSFYADLSPSCVSSELSSECLLTFELPPEIATNWHGLRLARFPGWGQIADEEYKNPEWVRGELVMVDKSNFVFIWEPIQYHIFFTKPPPYMMK